jgi:hypothetical protein
MADSFNICCLKWVSNNLKVSVNEGHSVVTRITTGESALNQKESYGKQDSTSCGGGHNAQDHCGSDPGNGTH